MSKDYYAVLGIETHVTQLEVEEAYERLSAQYSPDNAKGLTQAQCDALMKPITLAYTMLSDPDTRREYDRMQMEKHLQDRYGCNIHEAPSAMKSYFKRLQRKRMGFFEAYRTLSKEQRRILILIIIVLALNGIIQGISLFSKYF